MTRRHRSAAVPAGDSTPYLPRVPYRSAAQRVRRGGPAYRLSNRLERAAFRRRFAGAADSVEVLQRRQGRLRLVSIDPGITSRAATLSNRDLVVALCERHEIPYFAVPETAARHTRIGIEQSRWNAFIDVLIDEGDRATLYLGVEARTRSGARRRWPVLSTDRRARRAVREQRSVEVFRIRAATEAGPMFDRNWACVVDCWERAAGGEITAPGRNPRTERIGAAYQQPGAAVLHDRRLPTFEIFTHRNVFDVDFPIDAVYMWVDGADPGWQYRKDAALARSGMPADPHATADARFRDGGELRYSLRSVEAYAPWVRSIVVVTDQQIPSWLDTAHPQLRIVDHVELFGESGTLPSFNSHAIGARLHHIEGLSEHYIHFNDDFFLGRTVWPTTFFHSNGVSKFFLSRSTLAFSDPAEVAAHEAARRNVVELLRQDFGRSATRAFFHTPIVQRRSTMYELEKRYPDVFESTWHSQFRSASDFEINSWLHHYYGYLRGLAMPGSIAYDYFDLSRRRDLGRMHRLMRTRDKDVFCINDSPETTLEQVAYGGSWLAEYYPTPSAFERS